MKKVLISLVGLAMAGSTIIAGSLSADSPACQPNQPCAMCTAKTTVAPTSSATNPKDSPAKTAKAKPKTAKVFWGNEKCPIMGGKVKPASFVLYSDPKNHTYAKIHTCCPGCIQKIKKDTAAAYRKAYLDRELKNKKGKVVAKKGQPFDLKNKTCPISGGKVSGKNWLVYDGYKIGLCCPKCEKMFMKAPDKNLTKLVRKEKLAVPGKKVAPLFEKPAATQE